MAFIIRTQKIFILVQCDRSNYSVLQFTSTAYTHKFASHLIVGNHLKFFSIFMVDAIVLGPCCTECLCKWHNIYWQQLHSVVQIKYKNKLRLSPLCPVCNSMLALGMHRNTSKTFFNLNGNIWHDKMQKQVSASRLSRHYKKQHHNLGKKLLICDHILVSYTHISRSQIYLFIWDMK